MTADATATRIVVLGASAGGVEALRSIVARLPAHFPAAVCIVLHVPAAGPSLLPAILARAGQLPVRHAVEGDRLQAGVVLVAPPDRHLVVGSADVHLSAAARENRQRPSVDALFRSAAESHGPAVIGVVLSGSLDDGTAGLSAIKTAGGIAIVQSPGDAATPEMPRSALEAVAVDYALPATDIAALLVRLVHDRPAVNGAVQVPEETFVQQPGDPPAPGPPSPFTCPDCHGTLWESDENGVIRYRCRVGHAYSVHSLLAAHDDSVERALWAALRSLEESAALSRRLGDRAEQRGHAHSASLFRQREQRTEEHARVLHEALTRTREVAAVVDE